VGFDKDYVAKFLGFLGHREAGGVTEVRFFSKERYAFINNRQVFVGRVVSGYYDDYDKLAGDVEPFDGKANIYVTLNPCRPELLARAANRLQFDAKITTGDDDILCDLWFPFDTDPVRPSDISSTEEELRAALAKRDEVAEFLSPWAPVVKGVSGNGGHGLILLPGYPNTRKARQAKERLTRFLSDRFSDWEVDESGRMILRKDGVSVDNTVFNLSRIWKLYGTIACKGDNVPDRPYRLSHLDIMDVKPVDLYAMLDEIIPPEEEENIAPLMICLSFSRYPNLRCISIQRETLLSHA